MKENPPTLADTSFEGISHHTMLYSFSAEDTVRNADQLKELLRNPEILPWKNESDRVSLFAIPEHFSQSGETKPTAGFFGVNTRLLHDPANPLTKPVAIHEGVHLQIAGELRRYIGETYPDVTSLLHETMVADFLDGKIDMNHHQNFMIDKGWEGMSPAGVRIETPEDAKEILRVFFGGIKKQLNREFNGGLFMPVPYMIEGGKEDFDSAPMQDIRDLYKEKPEVIAKLVMTGYELGEQLIYQLRERQSNRAGTDLWVTEEVVANYVCSTLAGTDAREFGQATHQDAYKYDKSAALQQAEGSKDQGLEVVKRVDSYEELAHFAKEKGLV